MDKTPTNKLRKIRNLCNNFEQNLKFKPMDSAIDSARTRSFIADIMKVLIHEKYEESKVDTPVTGTREYWDEVNRREREATLDRSSVEQRQMNLDALKKIKGDE